VEQDGMNAAGAKRGSKTGVRRPDKGRAGAVSRHRVQIAAILAVAGVVGAAFVLTPRPDAAPFLWNDSPSMDTGIYRKTETLPGRGSIVSFEIPEAARLYARQRGIEIGWGSFLKPVAAIAGDDVCVSLDEGLVINGEWLATVRRTDAAGHVVAAWSHCRQLMAGEFFVYAPRVENSYDSRYYGPVRAEMIKGVYEPLWTW
jgi:conjugative transfer signal peptidase TraF